MKIGDIVVTIPKSEYENFELEKKDLLENDLQAFWTLSKCPRRSKIGDKIYFVKDNKISYCMTVVDTKFNSEAQCHTTGRNWKGKFQLILDNFEELDNKIDNVRGFQGFRYRWWEDKDEQHYSKIRSKNG